MTNLPAKKDDLNEKEKLFLKYYTDVKSETSKTLESWTGGCSYKNIFDIELFGFKLEFWKKL